MIPFIVLLGAAAAAPAVARQITKAHAACRAAVSLKLEGDIRKANDMEEKVTAVYAVGLSPETPGGAFQKGANLQSVYDALEEDHQTIRCPQCGQHDAHGKHRRGVLGAVPGAETAVGYLLGH